MVPSFPLLSCESSVPVKKTLIEKKKNVVIFSILSAENSIDFHDKTLDVLVKNLKYFLYEKYIKWCCNFVKEKYLFLY